MDASVWFKAKHGVPEDKRLGSTIMSNLRGWAKEWRVNRDKIMSKAVSLSSLSRAKQLAGALDTMQEQLALKAESLKQGAPVSVDDFEKLWKILRVENGLPTTIGRSTVTMQGDPEDAFNRLQNDRDTEIQDTGEIHDNIEGEGTDVV